MKTSNKRTAAEPAVRERPTGPSYRPEAEGNATSDLFAIVSVTDESSLLDRLKQLGADVYCDGTFPTLTGRLRHVIEHEQWTKLVSGRDPSGKVETFEQAFARVCLEPLTPKRKREVREQKA